MNSDGQIPDSYPFQLIADFLESSRLAISKKAFLAINEFFIKGRLMNNRGGSEEYDMVSKE